MTTNPGVPSIPGLDVPPSDIKWDNNKGIVPAAVMTQSSNASHTNGPVGMINNTNQTTNNHFYGNVPNVSVRVNNLL